VLNSIKASIRPILISSIAKFLILPAIAMGLCILISVEPMVRNAMLVFTILPTATASYVLAKQLGGDYELMATIITVQTLLAGLLMPIMLIVFAL
jgi:malonate transporter